MKTRFSIILLAAVVLLLTVEGCSTIKTANPVTSVRVTSSDIPYPWPPGYTQTNSQVNGPFSFIPYSLTNVIYPTAYTSGFYIYALTIGQGWGYVTNGGPPYTISFPSTNLLLFNGEYGDSGTNTGTLTINPFSPAYRFGVKANTGDDGTHGTNYALTIGNFALPMMITASNVAPNLHISVYGLNKDLPTYQIQSSGDLLSWSNLVSIPISNSTNYFGRADEQRGWVLPGGKSDNQPVI